MCAYNSHTTDDGTKRLQDWRFPDKQTLIRIWGFCVRLSIKVSESGVFVFRNVIF